MLDSTADEETTRRSIVRIEQMFAAYCEILPRRTRPVSPLRVKLFGSMSEYNDFLKSLGLNIENPAIFIADENLLAAGSELSAYGQQLQAVRARHAALRPIMSGEPNRWQIDFPIFASNWRPAATRPASNGRSSN